MKPYLKKYCKLRIKNHFKKSSLFFFYHVSKRESIKWLSFEQKLSILNLEYYKPSNNIMKKVIKGSIYNNFKSLISGVVLIIKFKDDKKELNIDQLREKINEEFVCLAMKFEDKIYSNGSIKICNSVSYEANVLKLTNSLRKLTKSSYSFTKFNNSK